MVICKIVGYNYIIIQPNDDKIYIDVVKKNGGNTMDTTHNNKIIEPCFYSCDNVITAVNKEFLDFTGYVIGDFLGKSLANMEEVIRINSQVSLDNINSKYNGYIFAKSLDPREVTITISLNTETNETKYTFSEIANSRLNDKLSFVEQIFIDNESGAAIYSVPDLLLLKSNQKYLDFAYAPFTKPEFSIGKSISEFMTGFTGSQAEIVTKTLLETQKSSCVKAFKFSHSQRGTTYWDSTQTPIFENGKMKYIYHTATDVTQSVFENKSIVIQNKLIKHNSKLIKNYCRNEEVITKQYKILNRVINTFDLPVIRLSCPDLNIIDVNKKAFNILKFMRPNLISIDDIKDISLKSLFINMDDPDEYFQCINELLEEKKTKYLNKKKYSINGKDIYWNFIFEPVLESNGDIQEISILIIDVTSEIKSNIVMENALKLQGEFLVNISHELKTPLNVIFATAQLFNNYCTSGSLDDKRDSIMKYIDSIKQNSYRLSKMINNIVDLSKIEAGFFNLYLSNNDIVALVEDIVMSVTNFTDSKGLNIIFDTDIEEKIIACDHEKLERVLLNLISNAIKFTDIGGEIFVEVKDKGKFIEISVADNGIGIEQKYLSMIFDRFKQVDKSLARNAEGTGIGLSLVKSIVELHGGNISVESEFGKGSKFTIMIPSKKVATEDTLYTKKVKNAAQLIRVELSDVCS